MSDQIFSSITAVLMAIIGVAIIATLVSQKAQTSQVIGAAAGGFAQDLGAALSPVTGSSILGGGTMTGGGANYYV